MKRLERKRGNPVTVRRWSVGGLHGEGFVLPLYLKKGKAMEIKKGWLCPLCKTEPKVILKGGTDMDFWWSFSCKCAHVEVKNKDREIVENIYLGITEKNFIDCVSAI